VDLSKEYDKISWDFIWRVLMEINFSVQLINIIMHTYGNKCGDECQVEWCKE
jgi:hypothetical protein